MQAQAKANQAKKKYPVGSGNFRWMVSPQALKMAHTYLLTKRQLNNRDPFTAFAFVAGAIGTDQRVSV